MRRLLLTVLLLTLGSTGWTAPPPFGGPPTERWIVELDSPALAVAPRSEPGRLDVDSPTSRAYLERLDAEQQRVIGRLREIAPRLVVERRYRVLLNALGLSLPAGAATHVASVRGVRSISPDQPLVQTGYPTVDQIAADVVWRDLGGPSRAGAGIKIAVIDGGIYLNHPSFAPDGFVYPPGFPKGDASATNAKVIAARAYFRPNHPPTAGNEGPQPGPGAESHGVHVAAIAAGNEGVIARINGLDVPISGVAPGAYLMNYRIFYPSTSPVPNFANPGVTFLFEVLAATEDAVADGADVVNASFGSPQVSFRWPDRRVQAFEAAVAAGVVVVNSAGNSGPVAGTIGSTAGSAAVIAVGAVTAPSEVTRDLLKIVAPAPAPPEEWPRFVRASFGGELADPPVPLGVGIVPPFGPGAACEPIPDNTIVGLAAIVARGGCPFADKAKAAQDAGAVAVVIVSDSDERLQPGGSGEVADAVEIPVVAIGRTSGEKLAAWVRQAGSAGRIILDPTWQVASRSPDVLAEFGSRGPTNEDLLKPDVVAPGVDILSAGYGPAPNPPAGFGIVSGTSQAAPQVAGAAALLRQAHPDWSPARIKSALMVTAHLPVVDDRGRPVGPLARGAGRIDVARAVDPPFFADPPSIALGTARAGQTRSATVRLTGGSSRVALTAEPVLFGSWFPTTGLSVSVQPERFVLGPGEYVDLTLRLGLPAGAPPADHQGDLIIRGPAGVSRLPFWTRLSPERGADVLLLDNDGSSDLGLADVANVYQDTLDALGMPFDLLDADAEPARSDTGGVLPPLWILQQYRTIVWFTGDRTNPGPPGRPRLNSRDHDILADYLQGGGRLLGAGRRFGDATDSGGRRDPVFGRSRIFQSFFGAQVRRNALLPPRSSGRPGRRWRA
ncbi:MAG: S8 family serine peptidase [Dehalococcoidia bacterium]